LSLLLVAVSIITSLHERDQGFQAGFQHCVAT